MKIFSSLTHLSLLLILVACGSDEGPSLILDSVEIASSNGNRLDITTSESTTLTLNGFDQNGEPLNVTSTIVWSSDNGNVSVNQSGLATAVAIGSSTITASTEGVEDTFVIEVWDASAPRTEIYVSDVGRDRQGPHRILRYDEEGGSPVVFISTQVSRPQDIVFLEDQEIVLVSSLGSDRIDKFDINSGEFEGAFATGLGSPTRIDIGPDGLLYVLQWDEARVRRYQLDGTFVDNFTSSRINQAIGMDWDSEGNLYVSSWNDGSNGWVKKFDLEGNDLGFFINSRLSGPTDIWFDAMNNLFVNDWSANSVKRFAADGSYEGIYIGGVSTPEGVAFLDNGNILIGAGGTSSIPMFSSAGDYLSDLVAPGSGGLVTPNAVVIRKVNH